MRIAIFFTKNMSLNAWSKIGSLSRELSLYQNLERMGASFTLFTYGGKEDLLFQNNFSSFKICCNKWNLPKVFYELFLPVLHRDSLSACNIIKTNQTNGAQIALRASKIYRKPLIARCGYLWSKNIALQSDGYNSRLLKKVLSIEQKVFTQADRIIVTTSEIKEAIINRFGSLGGKISIVPNGVDTSLFKPNRTEVNKNFTNVLCFVGRLAPEKNLESLIKAVEDVNAELHIIGKGPSASTLKQLAIDNPRIKFHGAVANEDLPKFFGHSDIFVFPSLYEGHPKALIEAMASGLPIIASNVLGIKEVIEHEKTGYLCNPDTLSIRTAILSVIENHRLRENLGANARQYAIEKFDINTTAKKEYSIYTELMA